ncbi:DUF4059 superfamily protein [Pseudoalteromonas virus vB_PspP-H6/1]|nr:DUF4059 superfamily protein [Pseudoalteromonas virus vB_PspP-H6/1]
MKCGLLKIVVVALAFVFVKLAELSFHTEYYHAALSAAFVVTACFSTLFAIKTKSKHLVYYASIYIVGAILYALMLIPILAVSVDYVYYGAELNFGLIILLADSFIIGTGGINVIYRIYCLRRFGSSGDDIFDARMGLHKWAR